MGVPIAATGAGDCPAAGASRPTPRAVGDCETSGQAHSFRLQKACGRTQAAGAQAGPGSVLPPPQAGPEEINETKEAPLRCCPGCGGPLTDRKEHEQFVVGTPPVEPVITRYVIHSGHCAQWRRRVRSATRRGTAPADALSCAQDAWGCLSAGLARRAPPGACRPDGRLPAQGLLKGGLKRLHVLFHLRQTLFQQRPFSVQRGALGLQLRVFGSQSRGFGSQSRGFGRQFIVGHTGSSPSVGEFANSERSKQVPETFLPLIGHIRATNRNLPVSRAV